MVGQIVFWSIADSAGVALDTAERHTMAPSETRLSARMVAAILAKIFGPSFYDGPRFGVGPSILNQDFAAVSEAVFDRRSAVMLNPQPLPPRETYAVALADAHIQELLSLHRAGSLLGGEVAERALGQSLRHIADIDELCPRWPRWPMVWPPPPPPPWEFDEEMTRTELFLFGSRFVASAELVKQEKLQTALVSLGEKALILSTENA
jgi:hypothetical protein